MRKKLIGFIALLSSLVLCAGCFGSGNDSGSSSSSNSIESEQSGNSSSDITDDSSSDDSSSDDSSSDDSSSDDSSSDDSSSDDSSSDDSSSDDSSSDDSSSDDSSSDDIVDNNKYAIGTEIYTGATMTKDGDTITYTANETIGAQVFEGVELAQGTDFVVYATIASGMTAENVGFIVGTLGEDNANHLLFQWRKSQEDFYVWKYLGGWTGHNDKIFNSSIGTEGAEIALVYKSGRFYAFLNGSQVCNFANSFDNGWDGKLNVSEIIGTAGTIKLGLSIAYGMAQFTEWGYSTDAEVIKGYVADEPVTPPVEERDDWTPVFKGEGAYCKEDETKVEINNGGYLIEDAVITNWTSDVSDSANWPNGGPGQNEAFEASTTVEANAAATQIGFALTADGTSRLQIVYNVETGRIRVTDGTLHREYNATEGLYKADQSNTFTIKYDGSVWGEFLINGTSAITNGWDGKYIHLRWGYDGENSSLVGDVKAWHSFGTGDTLKVGLVAMHGNAIFTDWSFTVIADEPVVPPVEPDNSYSLGTELYTGATMAKDGDTITYTANETIGAQVFEGVELAQGTDFVVYATVASGMTAQNVGFVVGTLGVDNANHLLFQWRKGQEDFYVWKDLGGWAGHNDKVFNSAIGTEGAEIALVYKNGTYYAFLNGEQVCYFKDSFDNGWGGLMNVNDFIGIEGTLKIGLSVAFGSAEFTEWGYSTDAEVIKGYVADKPETPPVVERDDWTPIFKGEGAYCEETENQVEIKNGGYLIEGAEIANWNNGNGGNVAANGDNWVNGGKQMNTKFSVSAKIQANAEENYKVGFIFTLNGTDYFAVVYNNEEKEIRVQASNGHYRDYGLGDTFDPAGTTMTLEYDGIQGMLLYFGEGKNKKVIDLKNAWALEGGNGIIFRFGYTQAADGGYGDNEHITVALKESSGTLKAGLIAMDGTVTFTGWDFAAETVEPETPPVVEPETPVIPEELVLTNENRYLYEVANWNNGNGGNVSANGDNWVNGGKQMNTKFTISAKIQANAEENYQVGFAFTLNGTDYFTVVYNNEEKEIRVQASNGHYRDYGLGDTFDPAGMTMTLEYDGVQGLILYFGEGENKKVADLKNAWSLNAGPGIIFRFGYTQAADGGFGDNEHITVALKESSGTLKVGFAATGTATFTDLSFSTENVL